jgi:hypothetical protein
MVRKKTIKIKIYGITVTFYHGATMKSMLESFKKDYPSYQKNYNEKLKNYKKSQGLCIPMEHEGHFAILCESVGGAKEIATIVHECTHCAIGIFYYIGSYVDPQNQEPFAYLVDHLVEEFLLFLKKDW